MSVRFTSRSDLVVVLVVTEVVEVREVSDIYLDNRRSTTSTELLRQASIRPDRRLPSGLLMSKLVLLPPRLPMIPLQDFLFLFRILDTTLTSPSRQHVRNISAVLAAEAIFVSVKPNLLLSHIAHISYIDRQKWSH